MTVSITNTKMREFEISFMGCDDCCPKHGQLQKITIFKRRSRLRNHAVKHLLGRSDESNIFIGEIDFKFRNKCKQKLIDIGCPYYINNFENPPCFMNEKQCPEGACLEIEDINQLEPVYTNIILEDLKKCAQIPRYACYDGYIKKGIFLVALSNRKLTIKSQWADKRYNVLTCYALSKQKPFGEICNLEVQKILTREAHKASVVFCSGEKWMISKKVTDLRKKEKQHINSWVMKQREKESIEKNPLTQLEIAFQEAGIFLDEINRNRNKRRQDS